MIEFTDHSNAKKQKNEETTPSFPLIEEIESVEEVMERTNELLQSAHHNGAVLIRRLPLQTARDFDALVQAFKLPNFPYEKSLSNAVRINRTERVFTANEAPPETTIPLHHEMAQTPFYPTWLFFFCEQAPETGGATQSATQDNSGKHSRRNARALLETVRFTDCATPTQCPVKTTRHLGSVVVGAALLVLRKKKRQKTGSKTLVTPMNGSKMNA